jgi:parvulin-like peptidyl-prolyl isomerase
MQPAESLRHKLPRATALVLIVATGLVTAAPSIAAAQAQSQQTAAASPAEVDGNRGIIDRVLVRVSGQAILYSDFEGRLQDQLNAVSGQIPQEQLEAQMPMFRLGLMKGMVEEVMLEQRAEELGIVADPNQIDAALMRIREENGLVDDNAWQQALAQAGLTEAIMREQAAGSLVQQQMMYQEISRQVFVSSREISSYYETNMDQFTEPEQVLFQQLIFTFSSADRTSVRERADNALTELRAGVSLTAAGNKYSAAVTQDAAGAAWLSPEDLRPEIVAVMQTLTPLDYSDVIETPFGYHIIQLMDRKEGSVQPLEEVAGAIDNLLTNQKMSAKLDEYTGELIKSAGLEIYAEEFTDLRSLWDEETLGGPAGTSR